MHLGNSLVFLWLCSFGSRVAGKRCKRDLVKCLAKTLVVWGVRRFIPCSPEQRFFKTPILLEQLGPTDVLKAVCHRRFS